MVKIENEQNNYVTSVTTTGFYCQFLLPCGYCTKLNRDCPRQYNKEIYWDWTYPKVGDWHINQYEITCKV